MEGPRGAGLAEMTQAEIPGLWLWALPLCSPLLSAVCPYLCSPRMALSFAHSQNATRATVECNSCKPNPHMLVAPSSELRGDDASLSPPSVVLNNPAPAVRDDDLSLLLCTSKWLSAGMRKKSGSVC